MHAGYSCCVCKYVLILSNGVVVAAATNPAKLLAASVTPKVNSLPLVFSFPAVVVHCCLQNSLVPTITIPYGIFVASVTGKDRNKLMAPSFRIMVDKACDNPR